MDQDPSRPEGSDPLKAGEYPRTGYAWYVVGILTVTYICSFADRQILSLLVRPIRRDLEISDTQVSLLMGILFVLPYIGFGILAGRWADTRSRRAIIAAGVSVWSMMTAGMGLARNFLQMALLRAGVGVGQSALSPAAYSLITDYFPKQRLATAISVYGMGIYIGSGLAYLLGGIIIGYASEQETWMLPLIGPVRRWQLIFFVLGLPGLLFALLMYTVREPIRHGMPGVVPGHARRRSGPSAKGVTGHVLRNWRTFLCHHLGFGLLSSASNAGGAWIPTFFIRSHGWAAARSGIVYGAIVAVFSTLGVVAAGRYADHLAERGYRDATMRVGVLVSLAWFPCGVLVYLVPSSAWAVALMIPSAFFASAPFGIAPAAIQQMMPGPMRAQASALYLFFVNLLGLGMGPTVVALITDYVFADDNALRYSLVIVNAGARLVAALSLWIGMRHFLVSLESRDAWTNSQSALAAVKEPS